MSVFLMTVQTTNGLSKSSLWLALPIKVAMVVNLHIVIALSFPQNSMEWKFPTNLEEKEINTLGGQGYGTLDLTIKWLLHCH